MPKMKVAVVPKPGADFELTPPHFICNTRNLGKIAIDAFQIGGGDIIAILQYGMLLHYQRQGTHSSYRAKLA